MKDFQTKQITRLQSQSPISDVRAVDGVLYFTVVGKKGKQRWKYDGTDRICTTYL